MLSASSTRLAARGSRSRRRELGSWLVGVELAAAFTVPGAFLGGLSEDSGRFRVVITTDVGQSHVVGNLFDLYFKSECVAEGSI